MNVCTSLTASLLSGDKSPYESWLSIIPFLPNDDDDDNDGYGNCDYDDNDGYNDDYGYNYDDGYDNVMMMIIMGVLQNLHSILHTDQPKKHKYKMKSKT
jgi:hypothetical protein